MPTFHDVLQARLSRRSLLTSGLVAAGLGWLGPVASARSPLVGFTGVPVSSADTLVVPRGYVAEVLYAWGDPISDGPAFKPDASNSIDDQLRQAGMHHDGMRFFPTFQWDIFALAGDPSVTPTNPADKSTIVGDKYGSPDGIYVDPAGRFWIQTDVSGSSINSGSYAGFGNNQMLCADPESRETRRFLVGPSGCEVTGVVMTPDQKTMFVGIQHPGEAPTGANAPANPKRFSSWPDGPTGGRPRSSCLAITRDDGGPIGGDHRGHN